MKCHEIVITTNKGKSRSRGSTPINDCREIAYSPLCRHDLVGHYVYEAWAVGRLSPPVSSASDRSATNLYVCRHTSNLSQHSFQSSTTIHPTSLLPPAAATRSTDTIPMSQQAPNDARGPYTVPEHRVNRWNAGFNHFLVEELIYNVMIVLYYMPSCNQCV